MSLAQIGAGEARHRTPAGLRAGGGCPGCGAPGPAPLLRLAAVPANSCLMLATPAEARALPRGDIALVRCAACGLISNAAFDPALTEYSERYEPTQAWSPTFNRFHAALAGRLAAQVPLAGRHVVEVGCGQGEFLHALCRLSGARGTGFDPAVDPRRAAIAGPRAEGVRLVPAFFSEATAEGLAADLLVCKMTLEHIPAAGAFAALCARLARQSAPGMRLFVQVPDAGRILREAAFEDIYYEHCSYFTATALAGLFARHGFVPEAADIAYGGQYLTLLARHAGTAAAPPPDADGAAGAARFAAAHAAQVAAWRARIAAAGRVVVWGSGSKGVSFLHALGPGAAAVAQVVDINPHRQGMFMAGTGHPIVAPEDLPADPPDTVVVMNAVYREEVAGLLARLGLSPALLAL